MQAFIRKLKNGEVISSGDMLWQPQKGHDVFFINLDDAAADPSFYFTQGIHNTYADGIYWKVMVIDGKLIAVIADDEPEKMEDETFRRKIFLPLDEFVQGKNPLPEKIEGFHLSSMKIGTHAGSSFSVDGATMNYNYIDIVDK